MIKYKVLGVLILFPFIAVFMYYAIPKNGVYLISKMNCPCLIYETKKAILTFNITDVQDQLIKDIDQEGEGYLNYSQLQERLDTATTDFNLLGTRTYRPTLHYHRDSIGQIENDIQVIEFVEWKKKQLLVENQHEFELIMEWLSLDLLEQGKAQVFNKELKKKVEYIIIKKYDDGLAWWTDYRFPNDSIFIHQMNGIR